MSRNSKAEELLALDQSERIRHLARLTTRQRAAFTYRWQIWAREAQLPPEGAWQYWLIMAGRGFGKTRAGAEWVRMIAENDSNARIALVAASLGEARKVMVEGESGLLAIAPPRLRPRFEPSRQLLRWPGGAQARLYSAAEPESLRGPQHSHGCWSGPEGVHREPIAVAGGLASACSD
ncbi:MAG: DNA-packaging protein [Sphingomonadaceae bacterium]|nr:DNA-packaging protein [Sphingomonadaceae bacterium]